MDPEPAPPSDPVAPGVVVRVWQAGDAPALTRAWDDPEIARWNAVPVRGDSSRWIDGAARRWADRTAIDLVVDVDGTVAGEVGLSNFTAVGDRPRARAELGVWMAAGHRGRGLATAAVAHVARWALTGDLGLVQVWARTDPSNHRAEQLFERLAWRRLGTSSGATIWGTDAGGDGPGWR